MAEAVVEERAPVPPRFYCHMCNVEIRIPNTDFTCPLCSGGFVEELPPAAQPSEVGASSSTVSLPESTGSSSTSANNAARMSDIDAIRGEIATFLMSRNGQNVEIAIGPDNRRGNVFTVGGRGTGSSGNGSNSSIGGGGTAGGRVRPQNLDRLDNVLFDFLQSLSGGDVDTPFPNAAIPFGNSSMFYMGNLGDYAWGREGIDTIVTQLLNQMETSGPPPLAKDKIAEIPKVEITAEEVDRKLQCSVCWEDFQLQEIVRRLPCSHIYHENCIVPWLDLHGTCPICRKSLSNETSAERLAAEVGMSNNSVGANAATTPARQNSTQSGHNILRPSASAGNVSGGDGGADRNATAVSNNSNSGSTSQSQNQRNVFSFDDTNVDLD